MSTRGRSTSKASTSATKFIVLTATAGVYLQDQTLGVDGICCTDWIAETGRSEGIMPDGMGTDFNHIMGDVVIVEELEKVLGFKFLISAAPSSAAKPPASPGMDLSITKRIPRFQLCSVYTTAASSHSPASRQTTGPADMAGGSRSSTVASNGANGNSGHTSSSSCLVPRRRPSHLPLSSRSVSRYTHISQSCSTFQPSCQKHRS
jgi:hypothetical protein